MDATEFISRINQWMMDDAGADLAGFFSEEELRQPRVAEFLRDHQRLLTQFRKLCDQARLAERAKALGVSLPMVQALETLERRLGELEADHA